MARCISTGLTAAALAFALLAAPSGARAAMEVHDSMNIMESAKAAAEALKQTKELMEIKGFMTEAKETLGPAVSLAMSVSSWAKQSQSILQCIVPDPGTWLPKGEGNLTSLCEAQDAVREHLGLPTSAALQGVIDETSGEVQGIFTVNGSAKPSGVWSKAASEPIDQRKADVIRARRTVAYEDAVFSAAATALALQNSVGSVSSEVQAIVGDTAGVDNINGRIAVTNKALASVLQELAAMRAIMAKLLELQAMEHLSRMALIYGGMPNLVEASK